MRTLRLSMAGMVILMLVGGLSVAVAAQSEEKSGSEETAPTGFTGWVHGLPQSDEEDCGGRLEWVGGIEQIQDFRCETWMGTSDPRFTGTHVMVANIDTYTDTEGDLEDGLLTVSTVVHRVENDDGAWETSPSVHAEWMPTGDDVSWAEPELTPFVETFVFTGEGAYEGLTAMVWLNSFVVNPGLRGVIFAGEPPPAPVE